MAKVTKAVVDKDLRDRVFAMIEKGEVKDFEKVNDRQQGIILTDLNGDERYIRLGAIVAELREDMTARELMEAEIATYQQKQADKADKAKAKAEKAEKDKAKRLAEKEKEDA